MHLLPDVGKIVLADATLVEDPSDSEREDDGIFMKLRSNSLNLTGVSFTDADTVSTRTQGSNFSVNESVSGNNNRDFKIMVDTKSGVRHCIHLVASTVQDKQAWISDIAQCMDNIHMHSMSGLVGSTGGEDD